MSLDGGSQPGDLGVDLGEFEFEVGLWAMWYGFPLPATSLPGCPRTGWVHEGHPPWRVIASPDPFCLPRFRGTERVPYTGSEHTVDVRVWLRHG